MNLQAPPPHVDASAVTEHYLSMSVTVFLPLVSSEEALQYEADRVFLTVRNRCLNRCRAFFTANYYRDSAELVLDYGDSDTIDNGVQAFDETNIFKVTEFCTFHPKLYEDEMFKEADLIFGSMKAKILAEYRKWAWEKEVQNAYPMYSPTDHETTTHDVFKFYATFTFGEFGSRAAFEACLLERIGTVAASMYYDFTAWRDTGIHENMHFNDMLALDLTTKQELNVRGDPCFNLFRACVFVPFERLDDEEFASESKRVMSRIHLELRRKYAWWTHTLPPRPYTARNETKLVLIFKKTHGGRVSVPIWYTFP